MCRQLPFSSRSNCPNGNPVVRNPETKSANGESENVGKKEIAIAFDIKTAAARSSK